MLISDQQGREAGFVYLFATCLMPTSLLVAQVSRDSMSVIIQCCYLDIETLQEKFQLSRMTSVSHHCSLSPYLVPKGARLGRTCYHLLDIRGYL